MKKKDKVVTFVPRSVRMDSEIWRQVGAAIELDKGLSGVDHLSWALDRIVNDVEDGRKFFVRAGGVAIHHNHRAVVLGFSESVFCIGEDGEVDDQSERETVLWVRRCGEQFCIARDWASAIRSAILTYANVMGMETKNDPKPFSGILTRAMRTYWSKMSTHRDRLRQTIDALTVSVVGEPKARNPWKEKCEEESKFALDAVLHMSTAKSCEAYGKAMNELYQFWKGKEK